MFRKKANAIFLENVAYVLNEWPPSIYVAKKVRVCQREKCQCFSQIFFEEEIKSKNSKLNTLSAQINIFTKYEQMMFFTENWCFLGHQWQQNHN